MSKHEPRAAEIKTAAAKAGFTISWTLRGSKLCATIKFPVAHIGDYHHHRPMYLVPVECTKVMAFLKKWYPDPSVTSWGPRGGNFICIDLWEAMRNSKPLDI